MTSSLTACQMATCGTKSFCGPSSTVGQSEVSVQNLNSSLIPRFAVRSFGSKNVQRRTKTKTVTFAVLGEGEPEGQKKKKFLKREEEPEQYWQTAAEKEGKNPMQTVLPYVAILGLLTPFIILGLAFAGGYIKTPNY